MRSLVIGGAGFIGSHLVDALVLRGPVTVVDDLSAGRREFLADHLHGRATLWVQDALDTKSLARVAEGHDVIFHLSANPEARAGLDDAGLDLRQGTMAAHSALDAARLAKVPRFMLASSGTVYGNTSRVCAENDLGSLPISLYGASKFASEALVSAYAECFGIRPTICRFGNVVGPRATHGAILDFCRKLQATPDRLEVLGDGTQSKPYLHVADCVRGILAAFDASLVVANVAPWSWTSVHEIAEAVVAASPNPNARIEYTGRVGGGWLGDVPTSRLDPSLLRAATGFDTRLTSTQAVQRAVSEIAREVFGDEARAAA